MLKQSKRWPRLITRIDRLNADILCLQEVDHSAKLADHLSKPMPRLKPHNGGPQRTWPYDSLHAGRTGGKKDGLTIAWRAERFELLDDFQVEFDELADAARRAGADIETQNRFRKWNVGNMVLLRERESWAGRSATQPFVVATTHLFFDPTFEDVKLAQVRLLRAALAAFCRVEGVGGRGIAWPCILAGDFNSMPGSAMYSEALEDLPLPSAKPSENKDGGDDDESESSSSEEEGDGKHEEGAATKLRKAGSRKAADRVVHDDAVLLSILRSVGAAIPDDSPAESSEDREPTSCISFRSAYADVELRRREGAACGAGGAGGPLEVTDGVPSETSHEIPAKAVAATETAAATPGEAASDLAGDSGAATSGPTEDGVKRPDEAVLAAMKAGATAARTLGEPSFTTYVPWFHGTIDYIVISERWKVESAAPLPTEEEATEENGGLPNQKEPSDHLPLVTKLQLV